MPGKFGNSPQNRPLYRLAGFVTALARLVGADLGFRGGGRAMRAAIGLPFVDGALAAFVGTFGLGFLDHFRDAPLRGLQAREARYAPSLNARLRLPGWRALQAGADVLATWPGFHGDMVDRPPTPARAAVPQVFRPREKCFARVWSGFCSAADWPMSSHGPALPDASDADQT